MYEQSVQYIFLWITGVSFILKIALSNKISHPNLSHQVLIFQSKYHSFGTIIFMLCFYSCSDVFCPQCSLQCVTSIL